MTTDLCIRQDVETSHHAFSASASFPRSLGISGCKAPQPTDNSSDQQYADFGAEKSASFFPPEAPQQEPVEFLVPAFHTRPYQAVPEFVTLVQREACLWVGCLVDLNVVPT